MKEIPEDFWEWLNRWDSPKKWSHSFDALQRIHKAQLHDAQLFKALNEIYPSAKSEDPVKVKTPRYTRLFVWDEMMKGLSKHSLLANAEYLESAMITGRYRFAMVNSLPILYPSDEASYTIGEVYRIPLTLLKEIDKHYSFGHFKRVKVTVHGFENPMWVYIWNEPNLEDLLTSLNSGEPGPIKINLYHERKYSEIKKSLIEEKVQELFY